MNLQNNLFPISEICPPAATPAAGLLPLSGNPLFKEFDPLAYSRKHHLSDEAKEYLVAAAAAPSRRPNGFRSNTVLVPSPEYGHSVGAESTNLEYAYILICRARPDVLRIYSQGPQVKIQGTSTTGSTYTFPFTPDFVVCTESGVEIIELENLEESAGYFLKSKNRYEVVNGRYNSPPVQAHFAELKFKFSILSETDLDARFAQNARFIHQYQVGHPREAIKPDERLQILSAVHANPGISIVDIDFDSPSRGTEVAYYLIAFGEIFTHLSECPLEKPELVRLFPTAQKERAFLLLKQTTRRIPNDLKSLGYNLIPGALIEVSGKEYRVKHIGKNDVTFINHKNETLPPLAFQTLLDLKPRIGGIFGAEKTFEAILAEATPEDLAEFQYRKNAITPYLPGGAKVAEWPHDRNVRRWRDAYKAAHLRTGVGLAAIFPGYHRCGNRTPRMNAEVETLIDHVLNKYYLKMEAETAINSHLRILAIGGRLKIAASQLPSYCTIARRCAAIEPYKKAFLRTGKRSAQLHRRIHHKKSCLGSPHGDKSFMIAHCDSTQLDLALTHDNQKKEIKHLWHTKMVEAFDGRVLATYTSNERPSADALQALMLNCVETHGAIPATIVVDWGTEHRNRWMEKTLLRMGVTILYRPKATPSSGAPVESYFARLVKMLIHNLAGNTKLLQRARTVTKAVDPRNHTIWSEELILELLTVYYSTLNDTPRRNRPSPNDVAAACEARFGPPPVQLVDREMFRLIILPYVNGVKRMVSPRGTIRSGYSTYGHDDLREFIGKYVDVRCDRRDPRVVYVDHPTQRRVIKCTVVTTNLKYADDANDAIRIVATENQHRQSSSKDIEGRRVEFTEKVIDLEAVAETEHRSRRAKPKPKPKDDPVTEDKEFLATIIPLQLETIV